MSRKTKELKYNTVLDELRKAKNRERDRDTKLQEVLAVLKDARESGDPAARDYFHLEKWGTTLRWLLRAKEFPQLHQGQVDVLCFCRPHAPPAPPKAPEALLVPQTITVDTELHATLVLSTPLYFHLGECTLAWMMRDLLGAEEVQRQQDLAHEACLAFPKVLPGTEVGKGLFQALQKLVPYSAGPIEEHLGQLLPALWCHPRPRARVPF